jgi:SAM-dependent methyltransferase
MSKDLSNNRRRPPVASPLSGGSPTRSVQSWYQRLAGEYDRRWSRYVAASTRETLRRTRLGAADRLLDIGCGTGAFVSAVHRGLPAVRAVGIDLVPAMLVVARRKLGAGAALVAADAEQLPFRAGAFDVVASSSSFHYWSDPRAALGEIARVLRPRGRLVLTDWCGDFFACRVCDLVLGLVDPVHRRVLGSSECEHLLAATGFVPEALDRYKINWLWGLMTAVASRSAG